MDCFAALAMTLTVIDLIASPRLTALQAGKPAKKNIGRHL
jgi:hypothetical protein